MRATQPCALCRRPTLCPTMLCAPVRRYKAALRACPTAPPEVRLGIAACSLKLGNTGTAELAYQRVLDLAPDCTPALLGLAVLKLHVSSDEQVRRQVALQAGPGTGVPAGKRLPSLVNARVARLPPRTALLVPSSMQHAAIHLAFLKLPINTCTLRCARRACGRGRACWPRRLIRILTTPLCCCCWRTSACARALRTRWARQGRQGRFWCVSEEVACLACRLLHAAGALACCCA